MKLLAIVGVLTLPLFIWGASIKKFDSKIVGGHYGAIENEPYQISLQWHGIHTCGGVIIGKNAILTAAHCTDEEFPSDFKINAGSSEYDTPAQLIKVTEIRQHRRYNDTSFDFDMSILVLAEDLKFNDKVQCVDLALTESDHPDGAMAKVTGWGVISESGDEGNSTIKELELPIISTERCKDIYRNQITANMICAGFTEGGQDACQGDSGGPLVYQKKLVGVVSWGLGCARPNKPSVYAKVSAMKTWICSNVADLDTCVC